MTREDIIRMAAEVEWEITGHDFPHSDEFIQWCERFAALVAAAEREPLTEEQIEFRFGKKPTRYMLFLIRSTERAHGIGGEK